VDRPVPCLLAEDDATTRAMLDALLCFAGYAVIAVPDGTQAWAALASNPPPLAVIDWHMPGMDGVEVVRKLRAVDPDRRTWVLILSGRARPQDEAEALAAGADAFMVKPPDLDALRAVLRLGQNAAMRARSNPPANR
jgi:DNA-binding response OmpR family regulator